jgi:TFIIF-interacting CTD phosphatase-like protein
MWAHQLQYPFNACCIEILFKTAKIFKVVAFTAGLQEYASLVLDRLDPYGEVFVHRLYRGACTTPVTGGS